jgi:hypothetical protein
VAEEDHPIFDAQRPNHLEDWRVKPTSGAGEHQLVWEGRLAPDQLCVGTQEHVVILARLQSADRQDVPLTGKPEPAEQTVQLPPVPEWSELLACRERGGVDSAGIYAIGPRNILPRVLGKRHNGVSVREDHVVDERLPAITISRGM